MTDAYAMDVRDRYAPVTDAMFARERRHSGRIRLLRRALPGLAIALLIVLVLRTVVTSITGVSVDLAGTTIEGGKLIMSQPKMSGFTAANRQYELVAERAIQDITRTESVDLEGIAAKLPVGKNDWAQVDAATGTLHRDSGKLTITSPVFIRTTDGMEAQMQSAELSMNTGDIHGRDHVEIGTGASHVTADSLTVTGGGALMVFENNVKMTIEPDRITTKDAAGGVDNAAD